jgi:hypothetical protein
MSTTEELLDRKSSGSGLENREYGRRDPSHWPPGTIYPQKLAITSPTSGDRVGIVRSRTQTTEFFLFRSSFTKLCINWWSYNTYSSSFISSSMLLLNLNLLLPVFISVYYFPFTSSRPYITSKLCNCLPSRFPRLRFYPHVTRAPLCCSVCLSKHEAVVRSSLVQRTIVVTADDAFSDVQRVNSQQWLVFS